jgi:hypothetical protein
MTYEQSLSDELSARLMDISDILLAGRDMRYLLTELDRPGDASAAVRDSEAAQDQIGSSAPGLRPYFLADLWLMECSQHLAGLGSLYQAGEVIISPIPLARTVLEIAARVAYILDPNIGSHSRIARAVIEDAFATQAMRTAAKRINGKDSDLYRSIVDRLGEIRKEVTLFFGTSPTGNAEQWVINDQTRLSPTDAVEQLGDIHGEGRTFLGLYDRYSTHTHASLGSLLLLDRDDQGRPTGLTAKSEDLEALAQNTLAAFHVAISRFIRYADWRIVEFGAFEDRIETVFPDFFAGNASPDDWNSK